MTSRTVIPNRSALAGSLEMMHNPLFQRAVDRAANFKCLQAIRAGKLRVVQQPTAAIPTRFTPRMDLVDDPSSNNLIAVFELPGVKTSDISLQIREGSLIVMGDRRPPQAVQTALAAIQKPLPRNPISAADSVAAGEMEIEATPAPGAITINVHELRFGQFYRAIPVPAAIKESDVTAALQDGMLTVTWPKYLPRSGQTVSPPVSPSTAGNAAQ